MNETLSPTSLYTRAAAMQFALHERRRLKELSGLIEGFETQRGVISNARDQLCALVSLRGILVSRGILTDIPLVVAQDALRQVRQLRDEFTADAASILAPRRLNVIRSDVGKTMDALREQLSGAWSAWAVSRIPSVNEEVLGVLSQISELRATVTRVRAGIQRLSQSAMTLPATQGTIDAFVRDAEAVTEAWNSLDTQHLSPKLLQFLREAGSPAGARLDALSQEVSSWLSAKGLSDSFRIRAVIASTGRSV